MNHSVDNGRVRLLATAIMAIGLLQPIAAQAQNISTVAGNGTAGFNGDGGAATSASINIAYGVAVDAAGNRYIADTANYRIRKVTPAGVISTVAGIGTRGFSGDGGAATSASIGQVYRIAVDAAGNLLLADAGNYRIRKVAPDGTISTIAGNGSSAFSGDGGPATSAGMAPTSVFAGSAGTIFFTDISNDRVRQISADGVVSTVAGNGVEGFSGDGGPATAASLSDPWDAVVDGAGNLYVSDRNNVRIRKVTGGTISTIAGNGSWAFSGDGGPATAAGFGNPLDIELDTAGNLYITDTSNNRVRRVTPAGIIGTFAGNGTQGFSGDGGPATSAQFSFPGGLAIGGGFVYINDSTNYRVRAVSLFTSCADEGFTGSRLTLCRQVCEIDQTPARLTSLIKLYMTAYRTAPPCAR